MTSLGRGNPLLLVLLPQRGTHNSRQLEGNLAPGCHALWGAVVSPMSLDGVKLGPYEDGGRRLGNPSSQPGKDMRHAGPGAALGPCVARWYSRVRVCVFPPPTGWPC